MKKAVDRWTKHREDVPRLYPEADTAMKYVTRMHVTHEDVLKTLMCDAVFQPSEITPSNPYQFLGTNYRRALYLGETKGVPRSPGELTLLAIAL